MNRFINSGLVTPPWGTPTLEGAKALDSSWTWTFNQRSMYITNHLCGVCFTTAFSNNSWSIWSNAFFMSNSTTHEYRQQRSRVTAMASNSQNESNVIRYRSLGSSNGKTVRSFLALACLLRARYNSFVFSGEEHIKVLPLTRLPHLAICGQQQEA